MIFNKLNLNKEKRAFISKIVLSFVLPILCVLIIFAYNKMNGKDYLVLSSDLFLGVAAGIRDFAYNIVNHKNLLFSFSTGLGLNSILSLQGLISSPFNYLYVIFYNIDINIVMLIDICLRIGFASLSFYLFSFVVMKNKSFFGVIISVFYSLSSYSVCYCMAQLLWIDTLYILPLLFIAFYWFVKKGKRIYLIILYSYLFINNFYLGYMVGIFSLIVFIAYLLIFYDKDKLLKKHFFATIINWVFSVIISVMISAIVWIPVLFFILGNRVPDHTQTTELTGTLFQVLNSLFWGLDYGIEGTYPYLYCGLFVLILIPLFFLNKNINRKEKAFSIIVLAFFLLCTIFTPLNLLLHGLDQPDYFWFRYSFLIVFSVCALGSRYFSYNDIISKKKISIIICSLAAFYLLIQQSNATGVIGSSLNNNKGFLVNLIFMCAWGTVIYLFLLQKKISFILVASIVIMVVEIVTNSKYLIHEKINADVYYKWNSFLTETVKDIQNENSDLYRMICSNSAIYNTDSWFGYNGISDFGNQEKYPIRKFLSKIGFATSPRTSIESGYNPASEMILGVKYVINCPSFDDSVDFDGSVDVNPYFLGIGYLVSGDVIFHEYSGNNNFVNTNEIIKSMSGIDEDCFYEIDDSKWYFDNEYMSVMTNDYGQFIFSRDYDVSASNICFEDDNYDEYYLQIELPEPRYWTSDIYFVNSPNKGKYDTQNVSTSHSAKIIKDDNGVYKITLYSAEGFSPQYYVCDSINIYGLDKDKLEKHYEELSKGVLNIYNWDNGLIEGKINVSDDKRVLFTSIPYDPGWHAYINGKEVETIRIFDGAFLGIMFPTTGTYDVSFKYEVPGLKIGIMVSLLGVLALIAVAFEKKIKFNKSESK